MQILLATTNEGKIRELKKLFEGIDIEILSLKDFENRIEVEEDRETFLENAIKKAKEYALYYNMPVLAEDSGLVVDALNGYPGVYSARFYGIEFGGKFDIESLSKDEKNIQKVLKLMENEKNRSARYVSVVAFYSPEGFGIFSEGVCEGEITDKPVGSMGFGYDPIFRPLGFDRTMAQLTVEEKNKISHRGKAFYKLKEKLLKLFS
ncbi:MAG: RdgB/HAM1 family non-canonical purine NTP pyrophosphatase [Hydrogenothermaceae bacterium]